MRGLSFERARALLPGGFTQTVGLVLLAGLLSGCQQIGSQPAGPVPTPQPTPIPLYWDERGAVTLLYADALTAPLSDPDEAARVPDCAIFGDRRIRWVEPPDADAAFAGAQGQVVEGAVDAEALDALVDVVADSGFFELPPVIGPNLGPVREVHIRLEGLGEHTVRVADIETAPDGFNTLYAACDDLKQAADTEAIAPTAGWLHVYPQDAPAAVHLEWPPDASPLDALAEEAHWISDADLVGMVWAAQRDYGANVTFGDEQNAYRAIIRVEGLTLNTPRQPRNPDDPPPPDTIWFPSPNEEVFVAALSGGLPTPHRYIGANAVDACTIFGDGRVIISESPIGAVQVGQLTERQMNGFLEGWLNTGFFERSVTGGTPVAADQVRETVTIRLYEGEETTQDYPLETPYLNGVRNPCAAITDFEPLPLPEGGYLWAEPVAPVARFEHDFDYALVPWPGHLPTLEDLPEPTWQADEPDQERTVEALQFAWQHLHGLHREANVLFTDDGVAFAVYVDVPDVTIRNAPLYTVNGADEGTGTAEPAEPDSPPTAEATEEATEDPTEEPAPTIEPTRDSGASGLGS